MNSNKILTIIGARPQFVKAAPLSKILRSEFEEKIIHTGQHYDFGMSKVFFNELNIPSPDFYLGIGSGTHGKQTGEMLIAIEEVLTKEKPNLVIVYGDTNTTLAGALAASKLHIPIAHIEAGLRSYNRLMPEETNRILTDHISDFLFAPSENAINILKNENIAGNIFNVGDIMYDAVLMFGNLFSDADKISEYNFKQKDYFLATLHRPENVDNPERLSKIFEIFSKIERQIIIPIHPRTNKKIKEFGINLSSNIRVLEPLSYINMLELVKNSAIVLTDSGGLQKEAYYLGVPCITLRDETEWVETVTSGWNRLNSIDEAQIFQSIDLYNNEQLPLRKNLYGNGKTADKISSILKTFLK